ncbi:hypothetical protein BH20ACT2_BH20ACT2_22390 [soil metagenome]
MSPSLAPADAVVALRSLPRRWRAVMGAVEADEGSDPDDVAARAGPDGRSALEHLGHAARTIALLDRALQQVLSDDAPVLHPAATDAGARDWSDAPPRSVDDGLAELESATGALAARVDAVAAGDWSRTGQVTGGGQVGALDLVRDAVETAVARLRSAEQTLTAVRGRP